MRDGIDIGDVVASVANPKVPLGWVRALTTKFGEPYAEVSVMETDRRTWQLEPVSRLARWADDGGRAP